MSIFDQRRQKVKGSQTNIAGNQYNGDSAPSVPMISNLKDLTEALEKIQEEIAAAKDKKDIPADKATDINYSLQKAIDQAQADSTEKSLLIDNLEKAKSIVSGLASVGGVTIAIGKIIDAAKSIL